MGFHPEITPVAITFNEERNIGRTLQKLAWAKRVLVVDSFSTDRTLEVCDRFPNVEIVQRKFDCPSAQINHGLSLVRTEWAMVLGADYVLTDDIVAEIEQLEPAPDVNAYIARFRYCIYGRPLHGSLYPPRELIIRYSSGQYVEDGHTESWAGGGATRELRGWVYHDDRKPIGRWIAGQDKYARLECEKLLKTDVDKLNGPDRIRRRILFAPGLVLLYCLFVKGLILDGWQGWFYVSQRVFAETLLSLRLLEAKLRDPKMEP